MGLLNHTVIGINLFHKIVFFPNLDPRTLCFFDNFDSGLRSKTFFSLCRFITEHVAKTIMLVKSIFFLRFRTISAMFSTLFFPIFPWILQLALFAWFLAVLVFLATSGESEYKQLVNGTETGGTCTSLVGDIRIGPIIFFLKLD